MVDELRMLSAIASTRHDTSSGGIRLLVRQGSSTAMQLAISARPESGAL